MPTIPTQLPSVKIPPKNVDGIYGFSGKGRKRYTPRDPVPPLHIPITK